MSLTFAMTSLLTAIVYHQPFCIVHIVETTYSINYDHIPVPFMLSKLCRTSECHDRKNALNGSLQMSSNFTPKLKNLVCFVGALLLTETHYSHHTEPELLPQWRQLMSHKYFLGLPYTEGVETIVVPESFYMFSDNIQHTMADKYSVGIFIGELISWHYIHLPPIFVIHIFSSASATVTKGWVECRYCGGDELYEFECAEETQCVQIMWQRYKMAMDEGKNVAWVMNWLPIDYIIGTLDKKQFCPMRLKRKTANCYSKQLELAAGVLFSELNASAVMKPSKLETLPSQLPCVSTVATLAGYKYELILTAHTSSFLFITSDSVIKKGRSKFGYLAFDFHVWFLMFLAVATIAVILSSYDIGHMSCLNIFFGKIVEVFAVLLDQANFTEITLDHRNGSRRAVVTTWLISAMLLSIFYNSVFKCDFVLETQYETKWKELIEISNFTIYVGVDLENESKHGTCDKVYYRSCDGSALVKHPGFSDRDTCALLSLSSTCESRNPSGSEKSKIYREHISWLI